MVATATLEQLHPWLIQNLEGSDLGAEDLASYVVSLLQSEGTREELTQRCKTDLQEFLFDSTNDFVNLCFAQIDRIEGNGNAQPSQAPLQPQTQVLPQIEQPQQVQQVQQQPPQIPLQQAPPAVMEAQGGQAEFRQNFRRSPQMQQFPPQGFPFNPETIAQGFPAQGQVQHNLPPFDMGGFVPRGGHRGGRGGRGGNNGHRNQHQNQNQYQHNNNHHQQRKFSQMSSIHNELSLANKRLIIEKIPEDKLNEQSVRSYFGKFGNLTKVRVDGQHQLAEIEFEAHDQALAAHSNPDPIFDNRFVKVYWRKKMDNEPEPELDVESAQRMLLIKQQKIAEKEAKRKEITGKIREVLQAQGQLLLERQQLLQQNAPQEALDGQAQRTEQLKVHLAELQNEAEVLGLPKPSSNYPRGGGYRGGYRGRGFSPYGRGSRGAFRGRGGGKAAMAQASLDLRPKAVLLKGISADKDEILRGHLASSNYTAMERQGPDAVVVDFSDRRTAEQFYQSDLADIGSVNRTWTRFEGQQSTMDES